MRWGEKNSERLASAAFRRAALPNARVVNSYAAIKLSVPVSVVSSVLLPTEGKPMSPTRVSPLLVTSKPSPALPPDLVEPAITSLLSLASLALRRPRWYSVALFFCVRAYSASRSAICSRMPGMVAAGGR